MISKVLVRQLVDVNFVYQRPVKKRVVRDEDDEEATAPQRKKQLYVTIYSWHNGVLILPFSKSKEMLSDTDDEMG